MTTRSLNREERGGRVRNRDIDSIGRETQTQFTEREMALQKEGAASQGTWLALRSWKRQEN